MDEQNTALKNWYAKHKRALAFAAMFLLTPILTAFGLGYEMKAGIMKNIPLAVLDQDQSEFSRTMITHALESDIFVLYDYTNSAAEMEQWIDQGLAFAGIIIPSGLSADMVTGNAPQILLVYDGSALMVAAAAKTAMSEVILTMRGAYLKSFYEGKLGVVPDQALHNALPITLTYRNLYNPAKNFSNYLLLGMLVALVQIELSILGVERSKMGKQSVLSLLLKCVILGTVGSLVLMGTLSILYLWFDLPYRGNLPAGLALTVLYSVCMVNFGVLVGQIISDRAFASQATAFIILPTSVLGGYTFPVLAMPEFFQHLSTALPFTHYSDAMRCLCMKGADFSHVLPALQALLTILACEALIIALVVGSRNLIKAGKNRKAGEAL